MLKQKVKTGLFFGGVGILAIIGVSLIVHSCSDDTPQPQAQLSPGAIQQYNALPPQQQQPPVIYAQAPHEDHFWRDMYLYHALFGSNDRTVVVHQPVYVPAPQPQVRQNVNVNKTVQNITINQTVNNHAPASSVQPVAAPAPAAPGAKVAPNYAQAGTPKVSAFPTAVNAQVTAPPPPAQPKTSWWATPAQTVKQAADYPKAKNTGGDYGVKNTGYGGYTAKASYTARSSGSTGRSGRR
jgi:hypothetical protein